MELTVNKTNFEVLAKRTYIWIRDNVKELEVGTKLKVKEVLTYEEFCTDKTRRVMDLEIVRIKKNENSALVIYKKS